MEVLLFVAHPRFDAQELTLADIWQNKRRDRIVAEMGISPEESKKLGQLNAESDMTDTENIHFRYQY